jgi:hypothetical protein
LAVGVSEPAVSALRQDIVVVHTFETLGPERMKDDAAHCGEAVSRSSGKKARRSKPHSRTDPEPMPHSRDEILVPNPTNVKSNQVEQLHAAAS